MNKRISSLGCFLFLGVPPTLFGLYMIYKAATTETGGDIANVYWGGLGFISLAIGGIFLLGALATWGFSVLKKKRSTKS